MKFPKHNIGLESKNKFLQELHQKSIGFSPFVFCEFFQGMTVLRVYGKTSGETFFGIYDSAGNYIGQLYFGSTFSQEKVARICNLCMPPKYSQLYEFIKTHDDVEYLPFDNDQYAFVLEKVLQKI